MGLTTKEWMTEYKGHQIRVLNTWFSGAKLYVDGDCRDECKELVNVSRDRPLLSASLEIDGERHVIEVFIVSVVSTLAKICVNGKQVGGDVF